MSWLDTVEAIRTKDFGKAKPAEREKAARDVVNLCSYAATVVSVSPVPFTDAVLMLPIQTTMVITVGHIYGRRLTSAAAKTLLIELGAIAGAGLLARQGIKALLPVLGVMLTVPAAFAANWGMGRVAMEYFKNPEATRENLKQVFEQAKKEASTRFSLEKLRQFRTRQAPKAGAPAKKPSRGTSRKASGKAKPTRGRKLG